MNSTVTLVGNLTRDPELRMTPSGKTLVGLNLAVNRRWPNDAGGWTEQVSFLPVVAWANLGENTVVSLRKGDRVVVVGRPEQRSWVDATEKRHSVIEFVADEVAPSLRFVTVALARVPKPGQDEPPAGQAAAGRAGANDAAELADAPF
jgi:single-strand DNA-binding protein